MKSNINIFPNKDILIRESAKYIAGLMDDFIKENGKCTFVLAGGSTPKGLYETLASDPYKNSIDWNKVHFFWGDERCVPPDHEDSNYRMVQEAMIDHLDISSGNIHRIPAEEKPADAAREYENSLKSFFGDKEEFPRFDIILLGIGDDGHTASLFPGTTAIDENDRWVTEVYVPQLDTHRITMAFPVINNGRNVIFLVTGETKAKVVNKILKDGSLSLPASLIRPVNGDLVYIFDKEAAAEISTE